MRKKIISFVIALALCTLSVFAAACSQIQLDTPAGVLVDDELILRWDEVENARSYIVYIEQDDGTSSEENIRRAQYSLNELTEGDYEIRVRAVSGLSGYSDSQWSETYFFHKYYENGCIYRLINNDTEYELSSAGTSGESVEIGGIYRGKPVTRVGEKAFRGSRTLQTVTILDGVTSIGASAFTNCIELVSVTIPDSVTTIGDSAFQGCYALTSITLPDSVTKISNNLFSSCKNLAEISFGDITSIGEFAFYNCSALKEFNMPDSLTDIGYTAFGNSVLETVTIGSGVQTIGASAFLGSDMNEVIFPDSGNLQTIGQSAFANCTNLDNVVLPDGLTAIPQYAFRYDTSLRNITIPDSVSSIGAYAFDSTGLYNDVVENKGVYVYADDWLVNILWDNTGYEAEFEYNSETGETEIISVTGGVITVGDSTATPTTGETYYPLSDTTVGLADGLYQNILSVERVVLPDSVKYIGEFTFALCDNLRIIQTSENSQLTSIGYGSFLKCVGLRQVSFGDLSSNFSLDRIGDYAFYGCELLFNSSFEDISFIPESVTSVGMQAFYDTGLYSEPDESGVIYAGDWVVGYEGYLAGVSIMNGKLGEYGLDAQVSADGMSTVTDITLKPSVRGIADYAFIGHVNLQTISGIQNVRYIGTGAFMGCEKLNTITLNRLIDEIKDYTFYDCQSLYGLSLPTRVEYIGRSAFYYCRNLTDIDISNSNISVIGDYAFYGCASLYDIALSESLEKIGRSTFNGCTSLEEIVIPDNVKSIGDYAFFGAEDLQSVTIGESVESIGNYSFANCTVLCSVSLPDSVASVGDYAFYGCINVSSLDLGSGLTSIGDYAFARLVSLTNLTIPDSVTTIGNFAFRGCSGLVSIVLPSSVMQLGEHAFFNCTGATIYTDMEETGSEWKDTWNSSRRPVFWGSTLSEDGSYVNSVTLTPQVLGYINESNTIGSPVRAGYTFVGWAATAGATSAQYQSDELATVPAGTTLYAVWIEVQQ